MPGASTQICRPLTRVSDMFDVSAVANIRDNVQSPTAGDGVAVHAADFNDHEDQDYIMEAPGGFETIDRVILYIYARANNTPESPLHAHLAWAGNDTASIAVSSASYGYQTISVDGSWTGASFGGSAFVLHLHTTAMNTGSSFDVDVAYAEVYGTRVGAAGATTLGGAGGGGPNAAYPQII